MCPRTVTDAITETITDMHFQLIPKQNLRVVIVAKKYPCARSLDGKLTPLLPAVVVVWSYAQKQRCKLTCCVLKSKPRNKGPASPAIVNLGVAIGTVLSE